MIKTDLVSKVLQVEANRVFQTQLKTLSRYGVHPTTKAEVNEIKDEVMYFELQRLINSN